MTYCSCFKSSKIRKEVLSGLWFVSLYIYKVFLFCFQVKQKKKTISPFLFFMLATFLVLIRNRIIITEILTIFLCSAGRDHLISINEFLKCNQAEWEQGKDDDREEIKKKKEKKRERLVSKEFNFFLNIIIIICLFNALY